MKSTLTSVVLSAGLALTAAGCAADPSVEQSETAKPSVSPDQQRIASTSLTLEKAFDVQFVKGHIDPDALQPMIDDVLQSMPDDKRDDTRAHIYDVIARGQKAASEMTPEQRAQLAAPVAADKLDPQQVDIIGSFGWGWPAFGGVGLGGLGWGGLGLGGLGWGGGWGGGFGTAVSTTTTAVGFGVPFGAVGWGAGWAPGWGAAGWGPGLGLGWGLGFGGLGAFGFPACGLGWGAGLGWGGLGLGFGGAGLGFGAAGLGWGGAGLGWGGAGLGLGVGVPGGWGF